MNRDLIAAVMDFIDEVTFWIYGGRGGDGCVSFRREKFVPKGGPDGGDGGDGGSVVLHVDSNISTLTDHRHKKKYAAGNGGRGKGKKMTGKKGMDIVVRVPPGTLVIDEDNNHVLCDLKEKGQVFIGARGGKGGRGNTHFATSTRQAPERADAGKAGEARHLRLELKILADVGLVGLPNAGKSTLLSRISSAKPKIADYPFTTLVPQLGIVRYGEYQTFVVADIPGLIEGAHSGKGLGDRFLRHIERTSLLLYMIDSTSESIEKVYHLLNDELKKYDSALVKKKKMLALTKIDLLTNLERKSLPKNIDRVPCFPVSSITGEGIQICIQGLAGLVREIKNG